MRVSLSNNGGPDEIKEDIIPSPAVPREGRGEGGGAKHWTDDEKGKLFVWMLGSDDNWAAFANQMNSVFREVRIISCTHALRTDLLTSRSRRHRHCSTAPSPLQP